MLVGSNSYEVTILAYIGRGSLEKQQGGPPHSSYSRGNTAYILLHTTQILDIGDASVFKLHFQ